ncbi:hypothetical protein SRHO_G00247150 [Serrasalmus rhombeus]
MPLGEMLMERALGVRWCVFSDDFQFRVTVKEHPMTRRGVLSTAASVYDPLGFVAPFILGGKQILQQLCRDKVGWDEPLPDELRKQWELWLQDLQNLFNIILRRCFIPADFKNVMQYELHHFSDASITAYGECTYLREVNTNGDVHCSLVMGKARVAPTKALGMSLEDLQSHLEEGEGTSAVKNTYIDTSVQKGRVPGVSGCVEHTGVVMRGMGEQGGPGSAVALPCQCLWIDTTQVGRGCPEQIPHPREDMEPHP